MISRFALSCRAECRSFKQFLVAITAHGKKSRADAGTGTAGTPLPNWSEIRKDCRSRADEAIGAAG
jgi:hypothetical protein